MSTLDVEAAYRTCQEITHTQAINFSYGIALLPRDKRRAMCAIYALARRIDDIGDDGRPDGERLDGLARVRADLARLQADLARPPADLHPARPGVDPACPQVDPAPPGRVGDDPVLVALADAARRFPIPLGAFAELVDGVELDVRGTRFDTFGELEHYCRCVAGSVGRLSVGVFGARDPAPAPALADTLGLAMQLTNILRDVAEDLARGRVYLPAEDMRAFGWVPGAGPRAAFDRLIAFEAGRARRCFARGAALLGLLDRRSAACVAAMTGIYRHILDRIERQPGAVLDRRVSLPGWEKGWIAARSLTGTAP